MLLDDCVPAVRCAVGVDSKGSSTLCSPTTPLGITRMLSTGGGVHGGCGFNALVLDDDFGSGGGGLDFAVGDNAVSEAGHGKPHHPSKSNSARDIMNGWTMFTYLQQ